VHAQSFPASAQEQLKELDETGDACLDSKEILAGIQALAREKKKTKRLMWLSAGLLVFSLLLLAAMGGLMFQVNQMLCSTNALARLDPASGGAHQRIQALPATRSCPAVTIVYVRRDRSLCAL